MEIAAGWKAVWQRLGKADKVFLAVLLGYLVSRATGTGGAVRLLLLFALITTGSVAGVKWLRLGVRRAIWRLRNRLLVAYLFIGLVPVLLIGIFAAASAWALASQIAVYLVDSEIERRMQAMERGAVSLAEAAPGQRARAWERIQVVLSGYFPKLDVVVEENGSVSFPREATMEAPPSAWQAATGIVVKDELLYAWSRAVKGRTAVTILAPLTRQFLLSLAPGLGDVTILEFEDQTGQGSGVREMRPHSAMPGEAASVRSQVPPPKSRFDFTFKGAVTIPVAVWDSPGPPDAGLLSVSSRFSAILGVIWGGGLNQVYLFILYLAAIVFLIVELVSLFVGVSITRTITSAFNDLYEGTQRIGAGDFSHRFEVRGDDQLAVVSSSFNHMSEQIQKLLAVAKESERMTAELEIAREVQRQLYPKSVPALPKLELRAVCNPARMVSGDYYDYQSLRDRCAVLAVGDVAGKGISAALLMATLQSSLRTHVRSCLEGPGSANGAGTMSTSQLVSQLNLQLYADTSPEKYATFFFSVYDDDTGLMTYTNAGHLPPVLLRKGKAVPLDVNGMVVGAFPFAQYGESKLHLESGDLLMAFTDGITEPENVYGEMFGEQRVIDIMQRHASRDVDFIIRAVMEEVQEWTGSPELQDDMTILVARRL